MLTHPSIRIGDRARFPLGRLGDTEIYPRTWEAIAFTGDGMIVCRRLHDGCTRTIAVHWWDRYTLDDRPSHGPNSGRRDLATRHLPLPRLNADRTRPGFYVSILHAGKPGAYVLAAGPFSYPGDAARLVAKVRAILPRYTSDREWWDLSVGTCKVQDGAIDGRWNAELGLGEEGTCTTERR